MNFSGAEGKENNKTNVLIDGIEFSMLKSSVYNPK